MTELQPSSTNRVLVADDDETLVIEYLRCLGADFEPDIATTTLTDLEKVLLGEENDEHGAPTFDVHSRNQGEQAVEAVATALQAGRPYSIVFIDIHMPPGMGGLEAAKKIREMDPYVNIVVVEESDSSAPQDLGKQIPPADKVFFFQKPFHAVECRQLAAALCGKWHSDMALRNANEDLENRVASVRKIAEPVSCLFDKLNETIDATAEKKGGKDD